MITKPSPAPAGPDPALAAAETLARWLDRRHLDPILGLFFPWAGDLASGLLGLLPVLIAWRRRAPAALLSRMLLNLAVDLIAGAIPILGDIWDFFFRAHSRNAALLRARGGDGPLRSTTADRTVLVGAAALFLMALATPIVLLVLAGRALFG